MKRVRGWRFRVAKTVEVILRRKVGDLGEVGQLVNVKAGYARNYLLPQGLAYEATEQNRHRLKEERAATLQAEEREREKAAAVAARLEGASITFSMLAGEEGKLYGSIGPRDIATELNEQGFDDVHARHVVLHEPIKALGVYSVAMKLHPDVETSIKVWVIKEEED